MTESMTMAEMAQPAKYAGMNYAGTCNDVKPQINLETTKQVGMKVLTHSYLTAMREFARDEEIVYSLMKEMLIARSPIMSKDIDVDDQPMTKTLVGPRIVDTPSKKSNRMTEDELVELAIETVKGLPVPDSIDTRYSYFAEYLLKRSNGELILDKTGGYNEGLEGIDNMKLIKRMRMEDRYKHVKIVEVGDYTVYLLSGTKIQVDYFNKSDGVEPYVMDYSKLPEEYKKMVDKEIEDAEWWQSVMESLPESSIDENPQKEDSASSLWVDSTPDNTESDSGKDVESEEKRLIDTAVEMTKSRGVGMMTDQNAPYFVQDEFKVTDAGELERTVRPFSRNIRTDEFDSFKESHRKRAQTYNASYVSCTDDYTAYIIDGGKTVCVFYYNPTGMAAA